MNNPAPIPSWRLRRYLLVINLAFFGVLAWFMSPTWVFNSRSILYSKSELAPVIEYTLPPPPVYQQTQIAKGCSNSQAICVADMLPFVSSIYDAIWPWSLVILFLAIGIGIGIGVIEDRSRQK